MKKCPDSHPQGRGYNIPTLCYHSEVSTFGACRRLCTVEDDRGKHLPPVPSSRDGMVIYTNPVVLRNIVN